MMETHGVSVLGLGPVTALGAGAGSLREGLDGIRHPAIAREEVVSARGTVPLPVYRVSDEGLDRFIARRSLRRIDGFSRSALFAAHLALEDAGLALPSDTGRIGIVFGSAYGPLETTFQFQDTIIADGDKCASPTAFANSVHNALASQVSIQLGVRGPCTTITTFGDTVTEVFETARLWLSGGTVDYVLAGVGENYSPVLGYALAREAADWAGAIRPFDFDACSYLPGEGFVVFVLARGDVPGRYGRIMKMGDDATGVPAATFLAANGNREACGAYRAAVAAGLAPCLAHAPLYGSMPTGLAFEMAFAAVALADGVVRPAFAGPADFPGVLREPLPLRSGASIVCLAGDSGGVIHRAVLEK